MIVCPEACNTKINSCSNLELEEENYDGQLISGNELDVAIETEVVADDVAVENLAQISDECLALDLEQLMSFRFDQRLTQRQLQQPLQLSSHLHPLTSLQQLHKGCSENGILEEHGRIGNRPLCGTCDMSGSVSTISIDDGDPSLLEEEFLSMAKEDANGDIFELEDNQFDNVYEFCDMILTSSMNDIASLQNVGQDWSLPSKYPEVIMTGDSHSQLGQFYMNLANDETECRKSARIAEKKLRSQSRRRSDGVTDDSCEDSEGEFETRCTPLKRDARHRRSFGCETRDEEFVLRRTRSFSKNGGKRRKSNSIIMKETPDLQRSHKQEKNRLAARRCRLKQKLLTDQLASEVENLDDEGKSLKEEIRDLEDELKRLRGVLAHHDVLVRECPTVYRCPLGPSDSNPTKTFLAGI